MPETDDTDALTPLEIAGLIVGRKKNPERLVPYIQNAAMFVGLQRATSDQLLTRAMARVRLDNLWRATKILRNDLRYPPFRALMEERPLGPLPDLSAFLDVALDLERRADAARKSPKLTNADGTTPKGRGRAKGSYVSDPKTFAAAFIILAFREVHGSNPSPRREDVCRAAVGLWNLAGKLAPRPAEIKDSPRRGSERWTGWRRYFYVAQRNEDAVIGPNRDMLIGLLRQPRPAAEPGPQD